MPYTFGAAGSDDATWSTISAIGANNTCSLICGWFRPTTLTADRTLMSAGTSYDVTINAVTDELILFTDRATTDQFHTTAGVDLVVDRWHFLAFLKACTNGSGGVHRVWRATEDEPVTEVTVTVSVAGSGNVTSNATFYVGNYNTDAASAFQGQIAGNVGLQTSIGAGASTHPFSLSSYTAISQGEADIVRDRFVIPAWQGNFNRWREVVHQPTTATTVLWHWAGDDTRVERIVAGSGTLGDVSATINGATVSEHPHPRRIPTGSIAVPVPARGRRL
jgi:hypothetical protein